MAMIFAYIKQSWRLMRARKLRSFLTMLGMIIGIAAVVIIISIGSGAQSLILAQVNNMGSNLIGILPGASNKNGPPASAMGIAITTLKLEDVTALTDRANVPHVVAVAGYVKGFGSVTWQGETADTTITGVTASLPEVENMEVATGRFFDETEGTGITRVVVLGSEVAGKLFASQDPIGQTIKVKRESFRVIGVIKRRGSAFFQNQDDQIFIPLVTAQKLLLGIDHLGLVRLKVDNAAAVPQTIADVEATLRQQHDIEDPTQDDFTVRSTAEALQVLDAITTALKFFLAAIAAIALVVGGVGIMNIMLVAVHERIREIGLRKAIGATTRAVMLQFLTETVVLSLSGGIFGVTAGSLVSVLVALAAQALGYQWELVISLTSIVVACGVSIAIGLIFGLYPAARAARLDPIVALRYE